MNVPGRTANWAQKWSFTLKCQLFAIGMWKIINLFQGAVIFTWTAVCAVLGLLLLVLTMNRKWAHRVNGYYLWAPLVTAVAGVKVKLHGTIDIPRNEKCILVANHESLFDIVALARVVDRPLFFIAKKELKKVPFMGWYMVLIGMVFVDRGDRTEAMKSMKAAARKIEKGLTIIAFPEGTRSKSPKLMMFKRGSFTLAKEAQAPIVPIGIAGSREVIAPGTFRLRPGTIRVEIGNIILPEVFNTYHVDAMASEARKQVESLIAAAKGRP